MNAKSRTFVSVFEYVKIVFCALVLALTYVLFVVPNNFAPAGLNGIATMIQYKCGFSIGYFSLIINVPLCVLAYFVIEKSFAVKSLVFCLIYSGVYLLFQNVNFGEFKYDAQGVDTIFPCLIAGICAGLVYEICFSVNSSTGGTDIVARWINKKKPRLNFFWITFVINALVAFSSLFVYGTNANGDFALDYRPVCLCILYCFTSSFMSNKILQGSKMAYKFTIVSKHTDEIEKDIIAKLKHSATRIKGEGIYSNQENEVLLCIINKHQIVDFKNILKKYDDTFSFVEKVNETVGNFKRIQ